MLAFSRVGAALATLPTWLLVGFQAFRLPLELLMHQAALEGLMPVQMSWGGLNLDVVSGATAPVVAALLATGRGGRRLALGWLVGASLLLLNVVGVAVASTPMLHAFGTTPERLNTFVAEPPYFTLPAVMVVAAMAGHLVLARALLGGGRAAAGAHSAP